MAVIAKRMLVSYDSSQTLAKVGSQPASIALAQSREETRMKCITGLAMATLIGLQTVAQAAEPVGPKLTPRLKGLLASEMQQVAQATADLALAIASGDHKTAKQLGVAVHDSFILKQSLTDQDKKDLMGAVPPTFIAFDRRFHAVAGKLAHAAESKDSQLQGFYYSEMLRSCVNCHAEFASDRFPGLGHEEASADDH